MNILSPIVQERLPVFHQAWWLDITAPGQWEYLCEPDCDSANLLWPIFILKKWGFKLCKMPVLTQLCGLSFIGDLKTLDNPASFDKILDELDSYASVKQYLYPISSELDTFVSRGYSISKRRTYRIYPDQPEDILFAAIKKKRRNCVRRGERQYSIVENQHIDDQIDIVMNTLNRKKVEVPFDEQLLKDLIQTAIERDQGKVMTAVTSNNEVAASIFLIWDNSIAYYLLGGYTSLDTSSFATSWLIWNAILLAKEKGLTFDFEGSMIENIASFFRSFGGVEVSYYEIEKTNSPILSTVNKMRSVFEPQ